MAVDDLLIMEQVPTRDGALHLFPEFVDQFEGFELPTPEDDQKLSGGTRGCFVGQHKDTKYVFKPLRNRKSTAVRGPKSWDYHNPPEREVAVAKILSVLNGTAVGEYTIHFEVPFGYIPGKGSLFRFENLSENREKEWKFKEDVESRGNYLIEAPEGRRLKLAQLFGRYRDVPHQKTYSMGVHSFEHHLRTLENPQWLAQVLMWHQGISNRERDSVAQFRTANGKRAFLVTDFEFATTKDTERYIKNEVRFRTEDCRYGKWIDLARKYAPHQEFLDYFQELTERRKDNARVILETPGIVKGLVKRLYA